jgi:mannose-1-phosphate guanylyltransferase/mannose-6-phosphate isomerase
VPPTEREVASVVIVPVILCGGAGTRLWPASREDLPKPFLPLVGDASTFALTLQRIADRTEFAAPLVVASAAHRALVEEGLASAGIEGNVLLEPVGRDTTAAIAAAAAYVEKRTRDAVLLVLAADHVIRDRAGFASTVAAALPAAEAGRIVVFGVTPDRPATGYGYIRPGELLADGRTRAVAAFIEKPDAARAAEFVAAGYLWNSGMFMLRADVATGEVRLHAPATAEAARAAVDDARTDGNVAMLGEAFAGAERLSVDYAVMEKTERAAVVEARFDWSDLGAWSAVWDAARKDAAGNVVVGDAILVDSNNAYVATETQRIGVVGLDDAIVVAADGAVLVTTHSRAGEVKDLVAAIAARPENVLGDYIRHFRPWGHYQSLDQGAHHQVKRIVVEPGQRLSLQKHAHRAEHWTVVDGIAEITVGMDRAGLTVSTVRPGEHVHIPKGAIHRMANRGTGPMTLIEVQVGDYLGEDDIVRLEDDYGR